MNWKKVRQLVSVDRKSGRLLRGQRRIKYDVKRNRFFSYLTYGLPVVIGLVVGLLAGYFYNSLVIDVEIQSLFSEGFQSLLLSLPTIVLIFSLIFTMLMQIQRSGMRFSRQAPYWLPVTWQEHTLAAILAEMLGFPIMAVLLIAAAVLPFAAFVGQTITAVGAVLAMVAAAFMASATTEIVRILQSRFVGAVYKSTGRAAVWVRFAGSIAFFIVFYVIYFYITSGANSLYFIESVASVQSAIWFVPFVWLGMTLYSIVSGLLLQGTVFLVLSILFMVGLFLLGTALNTRFGLYEPPAITISRGAYVPKTGVLGKLGFSAVEAALIRKDLKAFTRRRELIGTFIVPIVFLIIPLMSSFNGAQAAANTPEYSLIMLALTTVFPVAIMAMSMGNFMTGEEGQNIWRLYSSPVSAKNFVKSKYSFILFFSLIVLPLTGTIGFLVYQPSLNTVLTLILEAVFLAIPVGLLSLANGIKGADFNEVPRPRMIRGEWSLINMLACLGAGAAVLAPLFPFVLSIFSGGQIAPFLDLYSSIAISAVISAVLTVVFYQLAVGNAKELLAKAEV